MAAEPLGWQSLLGMGAVIATLLVLGAAVGWVVDSAAGSSPVGVLVGLLAGLVGAVVYTVRLFRRYLKT